MKITILSPRARAAVFAVLVAIFLAVLWGASELHYQGCVEAAQATTPDLASHANGGRIDAVAGCSHLP
jgi:hypothetical protein